MMHYIYIYTNMLNKKQYIGQTNNLKRRHKQHIQDSIHQHKGREVSYNCPIHCAIRKYGIENFKMEVLAEIETDSYSEVNQLESEFILKYNTMAPNGYNLKAIGAANQGKNKTKTPLSILDGIYQDLIENLMSQRRNCKKI